MKYPKIQKPLVVGSVHPLSSEITFHSSQEVINQYQIKELGKLRNEGGPIFSLIPDRRRNTDDADNLVEQYLRAIENGTAEKPNGEI